LRVFFLGLNYNKPREKTRKTKNQPKKNNGADFSKARQIRRKTI